MKSFTLVVKRNNVEAYSCFYNVRNTEDLHTKVESEYAVEYLQTVAFPYFHNVSLKVDHIFTGMNGLLVIVSEFVFLS